MSQPLCVHTHPQPVLMTHAVTLPPCTPPPFLLMRSRRAWVLPKKHNRHPALAEGHAMPGKQLLHGRQLSAPELHIRHPCSGHARAGVHAGSSYFDLWWVVWACGPLRCAGLWAEAQRALARRCP